MSKTVDLDINNYDLQDILNLFKIPINFDESDLKQAKQFVLKTHPDKSKLGSEYFLFYSKAYKMIFSIWEFRKKNYNSKKVHNVTYDPDGDIEKGLLLDIFFNKNKEFENKIKFNEWFNNQFEKNKMVNEIDEKGYGSWLSDTVKDENRDEEDYTNVTMSNMNEAFERKKTKVRALVIKEDIQELWSLNSKVAASNLMGDAPQTYDSDLFSGLGYQDLYKAHTESVIPVTNEDYHNTRKFNNVNEYVSYRNSQESKPLSEQQSLQYLNNRSKKEEEQSIRRGYELAKQSEITDKKNQDFWAGLQLLK